MVAWTAKTTMDSILSVLATIAIIFGVVMLFNFMIFIHELGHFSLPAGVVCMWTGFKSGLAVPSGKNG